MTNTIVITHKRVDQGTVVAVKTRCRDINAIDKYAMVSGVMKALELNFEDFIKLSLIANTLGDSKEIKIDYGEDRDETD